MQGLSNYEYMAILHLKHKYIFQQEANPVGVNQAQRKSNCNIT